MKNPILLGEKSTWWRPLSMWSELVEVDSKFIGNSPPFAGRRIFYH